MLSVNIVIIFKLSLKKVFYLHIKLRTRSKLHLRFQIMKFIELLKSRGRQRSGIDTIKYHTWPRTPYGKMTKTQENNMKESQEVSPFSQQVITRLQGTDCLTKINMKHEYQRGSIKEAPPWNSQLKIIGGTGPSFYPVELCKKQQSSLWRDGLSVSVPVC